MEMSSHLYYPTEAERERVRQHIATNSGFQEGGQPKAGRDDESRLYPRGIKSFAKQVRVNYRQMRRILSGQSGTRRGTWMRIISEVEITDPQNEEELMQILARMRGIEVEKLETMLSLLSS